MRFTPKKRQRFTQADRGKVCWEKRWGRKEGEGEERNSTPKINPQAGERVAVQKGERERIRSVREENELNDNMSRKRWVER